MEIIKGWFGSGHYLGFAGLELTCRNRNRLQLLQLDNGGLEAAIIGSYNRILKTTLARSDDARVS